MESTGRRPWRNDMARSLFSARPSGIQRSHQPSHGLFQPARRLRDFLRLVKLARAEQPAAEAAAEFPPQPNAYGEFLAHETRLKDRSFYDTPASWARISHERQAVFLIEGHRLAQVSLWETSRRYMPEFQNDKYPEGPWMIRFEQRDMGEDGLGVGMSGMKSNDIDISRAVYAIEQVAKLRNKAYHPGQSWGQQQTSQIDKLLEHAHEMAVFLHDRVHALEICALRDMMQREVADNYREIEIAHLALMREAPIALARPGRRYKPRTEWDLHHEQLFYQTLRFPLDVPQPIAVVAKEWNRAGHPQSDGYPASGQITEDDQYTRIPGQNDDYFRRLNRRAWDVDTPVFRDTIRYFGAPPQISKMTADEMRQFVDEENLRDPPIVITKEEQEAIVESRMLAALDSGLFSHPRTRN